MMPRYYICKDWNLPSGPHRYVHLDGDECLVRVEDESTVVQPGAGKLPHINDHKTTVHPDHATKLAPHGVTPADTCFEAVMKVSANHPDMEP